jgi:hypothetical protein
MKSAKEIIEFFETITRKKFHASVEYGLQEFLDASPSHTCLIQEWRDAVAQERQFSKEQLALIDRIKHETESDSAGD